MSLPSSHLLKRLRGLTKAAVLSLLLILFSAQYFPAMAQCASPTGVAGQIIFGEDDNVPAYCDGSGWIGMIGGDPTGLPSSSSTNIVPDGLVLYYRMDETAGTAITDSSASGYDASANATLTAQTGAIDTAIDTDEITLDSTDVFDSLTEGTISAWIKWEGSTTSEMSVFTLYNATADSHFQPLQVQNGEMKLYGCSTNFTTSTTPITPGLWHHILYHSDSTNGHKVYVDGVEVRSSATHAFFNNCDSVGNTSSYRIGHAGGFEQFNGPIDDLRIYNRVLTDNEIQQLARAKDGISYNKNHRTMEFFDGNQFTSMTPEWVVPSAPKTAECTTTIGEVCSDGTVYAGLSTDGSVPMYTTRCNVGQTWDGANCTGSASQITWNENFAHTDYTTTGATDADDGDGNTALIITVDADGTEAGVQQHDAAQVCADLSQDGYDDWYLPAGYELQVIYDNRVAIGNTPVSETWSSTEAGTGSAYRIDFSDGNVAAATKNGSYFVRCVRQASATGSNLVAHYKLDETTGTTAYDSSSNNNNGTLQNGMDAAIDSIPGAVGTALSFDGVDDGAEVASFADLNIATDGSFSQFLWFKKSTDCGANAGGDNEVMATRYGSGFTNRTWWFGCEASSDALTIRFYGSSSSATVTGPVIDDGQWHHGGWIYDANVGEVRLYLDGTEVNSQSYTLDVDMNLANPLCIGSYDAQCDDSRFYFRGKLDDVRLYNRVLTAPEIQNLYQMGAPVGSSTALPQGCSNVSDVCDDGTIYAGLSPDGSVAMFAAASTTEVEKFWNNGLTNWTTAGTTNSNDGDGNTNTLAITDSDGVTAGFQTHEAAQYCYDLVAHGAEDWYLPALNELTLLYNSGDPITDFFDPADDYWTSTEGGSNDQAVILRDNGSTGTSANNKDNTGTKVRCVRKGPAPRCANPYGLEGQMIYNTNGNVVQYCDGARWIAIGKDN